MIAPLEGSRRERALDLWVSIFGRPPLMERELVALDRAIAVLAERPRDAHGARLAIHDVLCINEETCTARDDHARRSQSDGVRRLRKALAAEGDSA